MRMRAKAIAVAAVGTALSLVFMLISNFVPVIRTTPLILACIAIQIVFMISGLVAGILSMMASLGICFAFSGLNSTFLISALLFYPYCLVTYFIRNYGYKGFGILIRLAVSGAIANISLAAMFFLTKYLFFDLGEVCTLLGGYGVLAVIFTIIIWIFDFVIYNGVRYLSKSVLRRGK